MNVSVPIEQLMQEASQKVDSGNYPDAIDLYLKVLEDKPDYPEACLILGSVYGELGQLDDATAMVNKAIELDPDDSVAHLTLGHILRSQGQPGQALQSFRRAVECDPQNSETHCTYGSMLNELERRDEAVTSFERAIECNAENSVAWVTLGTLQFSAGNLERAEEAYRKALNLLPANTEVAITLYRVLTQRDNAEGAEAVLRDAISSGEPDSMLYYYLALNLLGQGRHSEAFEHSEEARRLDPDSAKITVLQAHILERKGEPDRSFELLKPLLEVEDVRVDVALAFGRLAPVLGLKKEANLLLQKVSGRPLNDRQRANIEQARKELDREG